MATLDEKMAKRPEKTAFCSNPNCNNASQSTELLFNHKCSMCGSLFVPTPKGLALCADNILSLRAKKLGSQYMASKAGAVCDNMDCTCGWIEETTWAPLETEFATCTDCKKGRFMLTTRGLEERKNLPLPNWKTFTSAAPPHTRDYASQPPMLNMLCSGCNTSFTHPLANLYKQCSRCKHVDLHVTASERSAFVAALPENKRSVIVETFKNTSAGSMCVNCTTCNLDNLAGKPCHACKSGFVISPEDMKIPMDATAKEARHPNALGFCESAACSRVTVSLFSAIRGAIGQNNCYCGSKMVLTTKGKAAVPFAIPLNALRDIKKKYERDRAAVKCACLNCGVYSVVASNIGKKHDGCNSEKSIFVDIAQIEEVLAMGPIEDHVTREIAIDGDRVAACSHASCSNSTESDGDVGDPCSGCGAPGAFMITALAGRALDMGRSSSMVARILQQNCGDLEALDKKLRELIGTTTPQAQVATPAPAAEDILNKKGSTTMAPTTASQTPTAFQRALDMAKKDASKASWRVAATQLTNLAKPAFLAALTTGLAPDDNIRMGIIAFFNSPPGEAVFRGIVGMGLTLIPLDNNIRESLGEELRVSALERGGDWAASFIVQPLAEILNTAVKNSSALAAATSVRADVSGLEAGGGELHEQEQQTAGAAATRARA